MERPAANLIAAVHSILESSGTNTLLSAPAIRRSLTANFPAIENPMGVSLRPALEAAHRSGQEIVWGFVQDDSETCAGYALKARMQKMPNGAFLVHCAPLQLLTRLTPAII